MNWVPTHSAQPPTSGGDPSSTSNYVADSKRVRQVGGLLAIVLASYKHRGKGRGNKRACANDTAFPEQHPLERVSRQKAMGPVNNPAMDGITYFHRLAVTSWHRPGGNFTSFGVTSFESSRVVYETVTRRP